MQTFSKYHRAVWSVWQELFLPRLKYRRIIVWSHVALSIMKKWCRFQSIRRLHYFKPWRREWGGNFEVCFRPVIRILLCFPSSLMNPTTRAQKKVSDCPVSWLLVFNFPQLRRHVSMPINGQWEALPEGNSNCLFFWYLFTLDDGKSPQNLQEWMPENRITKSKDSNEWLLISASVFTEGTVSGHYLYPRNDRKFFRSYNWTERVKK